MELTVAKNTFQKDLAGACERSSSHRPRANPKLVPPSVRPPRPQIPRSSLGMTAASMCRDSGTGERRGPTCGEIVAPSRLDLICAAVLALLCHRFPRVASFARTPGCAPQPLTRREK